MSCAVKKKRVNEPATRYTAKIKYGAIKCRREGWERGTR